MEELMATTVRLDDDGEAIRRQRPTGSGDLGTRDWRGAKRIRVWFMCCTMRTRVWHGSSAARTGPGAALNWFSDRGNPRNEPNKK